ncbi:uncharacterized protein TNCV_2271071 [Trichonephila clavipes]|nr:uncharacterized protein TNCV_2271071 [Trichonephila clavipes]
MSRSGDQSEARLPVFKPPCKLGTHLLTHCSRDEKPSLPWPARVILSLSYTAGHRKCNTKKDKRYRPSSFHTLPKLFWCGSCGCNLGQSLSNHGPHVFYRRKIRRASRSGKEFNLVIDEEPLDNACYVWSRIILLKYGCGQALKVRKDNWLQHLGDVALAV